MRCEVGAGWLARPRAEAVHALAPALGVATVNAPATFLGACNVAPSSLSDLTANPLILLKWYYFLEAKLLSLFKGLKISMMPSPTGC